MLCAQQLPPGCRAFPFKDSREPRPAPDNFGWVNPRSFQIISPGVEDAAFAEASTNPLFPGGPYTDAQLDMMSNFTAGTMRDAIP
ncbi:MAG: hypothetical protein RBS80_21950 [Thermoguttaceae bacterium]|jgi:hypothetical protein|nr:hypothetical protein [Thermoguttaceae bacterium]